MRQLSTVTYQFFPFLVIKAAGDFIFSLHQETISPVSCVSKERFLRILSAPSFVVCNCLRFASNSFDFSNFTFTFPELYKPLFLP